MIIDSIIIIRKRFRRSTKYWKYWEDIYKIKIYYQLLFVLSFYTFDDILFVSFPLSKLSFPFPLLTKERPTRAHRHSPFIFFSLFYIATDPARGRHPIESDRKGWKMLENWNIPKTKSTQNMRSSLKKCLQKDFPWSLSAWADPVVGPNPNWRTDQP